MSKPNKREQWADKLKQDLREVLGLYDLQILEDDQQWLLRSDYKDAFYIEIAPFSTHLPWEDNRGAKKGAPNRWGKVKEAE